MKKRMLWTMCLLLMAAGILAAAFKQKPDSGTSIVIWNDHTRIVRDMWYDSEVFSEKESFPYYLIAEAEKYDYVMAEILVGEENGKFHWTYGEDRDTLAKSYKLQKAAPPKTEDQGPADRWFFIKLKTDDLYDIDIWHGVQEHWGASAKNSLDAFVNEPGNICEMRECSSDGGTISWSAYIKDDFFYAIECVEHPVTSEEDLEKPIRYFYMKGILDNPSQYCMWGMDEELFYWRDHDKRIISLENPDRVFTQVRGKDDGWSSFEGKQPCGILTSAEYQLALSEDMPDVKIRLTLNVSMEDLYLMNYGAADYPYLIEVTDAKTGKIISRDSVPMSVDAIDTIQFQDLDDDGYLDMYMVYPEHQIVTDLNLKGRISDDGYFYQFSEQWFDLYDEPTYYENPSYYYAPLAKRIWDTKSASFVKMSGSEISARKQKNNRVIIIVQQGDTLWRIAEQYLGYGGAYMSLYDRNMETIGADPDRILPGMELTIPDRSQLPNHQ